MKIVQICPNTIQISVAWKRVIILLSNNEDVKIVDLSNIERFYVKIVDLPNIGRFYACYIMYAIQKHSHGGN